MWVVLAISVGMVGVALLIWFGRSNQTILYPHGQDLTDDRCRIESEVLTGTLSVVGSMRFYDVGLSTDLGRLKVAWPASVLPDTNGGDPVLRDPNSHEIKITDRQAVELSGWWDAAHELFTACTVGTL